MNGVMGIMRAVRCRVASWIAPKAMATVDVELRIDQAQVDAEVSRVCDALQAAVHHRQVETRRQVLPTPGDEGDCGSGCGCMSDDVNDEDRREL